MWTLEVTRAAAEDLDAIWLYIAQDNVDAADRHIDLLRDCFLKLAKTPFLGVKREELADGLRSFPVGNYLIFHRPQIDGVVILRVIEGHRDIKAEYFEQ